MLKYSSICRGRWDTSSLTTAKQIMGNNVFTTSIINIVVPAKVMIYLYTAVSYYGLKDKHLALIMERNLKNALKFVSYRSDQKI